MTGLVFSPLLNVMSRLAHLQLSEIKFQTVDALTQKALADRVNEYLYSPLKQHKSYTKLKYDKLTYTIHLIIQKNRKRTQLIKLFR